MATPATRASPVLFVKSDRNRTRLLRSSSTCNKARAPKHHHPKINKKEGILCWKRRFVNTAFHEGISFELFWNQAIPGALLDWAETCFAATATTPSEYSLGYSNRTPPIRPSSALAISSYGTDRANRLAAISVN